MGLYSKDLIQEIQNKTDIVEIISEYVSLKKRGESFVGLCPFHSEKTPSFNVSRQKQLFYCFGCGVGGNVFTFLMKKESLSFHEVLALLADRLNIKLPEKYDKDFSDDYKEKREVFRLNQLASKFFNYNLLKTEAGKPALEYLKKRGITLETIERFNLGYALPAWDGLIRFFASRGVDTNSLSKTGLIIPRKDGKGYYDRFRGRVMFPIEDTRKSVIGFGGRVIGSGQPKYLNSPETLVFSKGQNLYGLSMIKKDPNMEIIVVEGYMDCISLHQMGLTQTVASLGTALTEKQAQLLKRFSDGVILAYDADTAGQAATLRGADILAKEGLSVKILSLPESKDPDEYIRKRGLKAFQEQVSKAVGLIDYKLDLAKKDLDISTADGKIKFIKRAIDILAGIDDEVTLDLYIKNLAERYGILPQSIKNEVMKKRLPNNGFKYKKAQVRDNNKEFRRLMPLNGIYKAEIELLRIFIEDENARQKMLNSLTPEDFTGKATKSLARVLFDMIERNEEITASNIINNIDEQISSFLTKLLLNQQKNADDSMISSLIAKVKEGHLKYAILKVREQIRKAEIVGEREETINLLNTYQKLKSQIEQLQTQFTPGKGGA